MANTRQIPLHERPDEQILEDLCIELRHVGVGDYGLPNEARLVEHIHEVNAIHAELARRGVAPDQHVTIVIEPDDGLAEARRFSRPKVIEAGWSDDDIDRLIKQAQKEVEPGPE